MKARIVFLTLILCLAGFPAMVGGAEVAKIGVIDFQVIIDTSNAGKRSATDMKTQGKEMEQTLKEKEAEVEELKKALEQKALVMSEEAREKKERDLRIKAIDFDSLRKRYLETLKDLNLKLSDQIKEDVFQIVEEIGKREGYLLILERRVGGVVYAPNAIDITDRVIEAYNKQDAQREKQ
ncbi:MAG: OmpH family outer membrane protein [Thermodesulfobacteriota bacterium]|nr:OmpH family outer membrane protein [Thermodesulfobacteriota bacterium]